MKKMIVLLSQALIFLNFANHNHGFVAGPACCARTV